MTSDPHVIKAVFNEKPEKDHWYRYLRDWLGDGLVLSAGQKWHTRRKLLTPSFHFETLKSYHETFNKTTNVFIECIRAKGEDKVS